MQETPRKQTSSWLRLLTIALPVLSLVGSLIALTHSFSEAAKADPRPEDAAVQEFIPWETEYPSGDPELAHAGTLVYVFQVTNLGRFPTSVVEVHSERDGSLAEFRQVDGADRAATHWNDPILIEGGSTVTLAAYLHVWEDTCDARDLEACPELVVSTNDGSEIPHKRLVTVQDCTSQEEAVALCQRASRIAVEVAGLLEESRRFCREGVLAIDGRRSALDPEWESLSPEEIDEVCAAHTSEY